jgi:hypothetical protein
MTVPVGLLFLAAWLLGGAALLWAGGRFLARLPSASFRRSLAARALQAACAWGIMGLGRLLHDRLAAPGSPAGFAEALVVTVVTLLAFWQVIAWLFRATLGKAILAWLPMAGEVFVLFPLALLLPELPFWL